MGEGELAGAVTALGCAVDALLAAPVERATARELAAVIEAVEVQRRRLESVDQKLLATATQVGVAGELGRSSVADVLADLLRVDPREARARVGRATDLGPRRSLTGEVLEPLLPVAAAAVAAGEVSPAQVDVIVDCLEKISPSAPAAAWPVAERVLVEAARFEAPRQLRRTAAELLARLDPDGVEPAEDKADRKRGFTLVKKPDGTATPRGSWTAETTALWEAILDSLAAPQPSDEDGLRDDRSPARRRHDAMADAAARLLRSGSLPPAGGVPVTVLATTTITELATAAGFTPAADPEPGPGGAAPLSLTVLAEQAGLDPAGLQTADTSGLALLGHGHLVSAKQLLTIACEARVVPVIFNHAGGILAYGDGHRLATRAQRLALAARDGGCTFPGCTRPAAWAEVHHVVEWAAGGGTDLANMCLVCRFHHRNYARFGWSVEIRNGVPVWIPPAWIDPQRRPRRNRAHHPPDITFREPTQAA